MGCCVSCALGEAPHKEGYGYGGDVIKKEAENQTIQTQLGLYDSPPVAPPAGSNAAASGAAAGGTGENPASTTGQTLSSPPRGPNSPPQPAPVYAPQAQYIPQVATFEMNERTSPPAAYSQLPPEQQRGGYPSNNQGGYMNESVSDRGQFGGMAGGYGGRADITQGQDMRSRGGGYADRGGRGGMPPREATRGGLQQPQRGGYGPPPFAAEQTPSSRQGGRGYEAAPQFSPPYAGEQRSRSRSNSRPRQPGPGYDGPGQFAPPFSGDARPSSRQAGRGGPPPNRGGPGPGGYGTRGGGYGAPPFAGEQRSNSRQGGGGGPPPNRGGPVFGGNMPRGGGARGPAPEQQSPYQQRNPPQQHQYYPPEY